MKKCINEFKEFSFGKTGISTCTLRRDASINPVSLNFVDQKEDNKNYTLSYNFENGTVVSHIETFDNINVIREKEEVSGSFILSSLMTTIKGICKSDDIYSELSDGNILIHYPINRWQAEGQWRTFTPDDLGLIGGTVHEWEKNSFRLESISSFSTSTYYPLLIVEDKKNNECWFFEIEGGKSWLIELSVIGGIYAKELQVNLSTADERIGYLKELNNDSYISSEVIYGVVDGGFEEAIQELIKYKRQTSLVKFGTNVIFNDYMNCNWARESRERLIPLIDKASLLGVKYFVIDDGWMHALGIWEANDEKFGKDGLKGIFDYIISKGMKPGIWFEFESFSHKAKEYTNIDDAHLTRYSETIDNHRPLTNMRNDNIIKYFEKCVDYLYGIGLRYIKNDHNNNELLGPTNYDKYSGVGLENNSNAFIKFIDGLINKYKDLIIENCGSGAMRSDNGTLKHFHLQSTSDQELYYLYPSIIGGSLALMPPEKAGIWCYPYPLLFDERENEYHSKERLESFKDGKETIFNVVSSFMGSMYVSGRIDEMDEYNFSLLKEGVNLYKTKQHFIDNSLPVFPKGMIRLSNQTDYSLGLINYDKDNLVLAVWNLSDKAKDVVVDLSKYSLSKIKKIYPTNSKETIEYKNNILTVSFEEGKTARLFELNK